MLFFFCLQATAFDAAGVTLFAKLPLLVSFSHESGLVIADVEHHVTTSWWEPWDRRKTRGIRQWIQIIFVVEVFNLSMDGARRSGAGVAILGKCMNRAFTMFLDSNHVDSVAW
jgi:hypothetical protein